MAESAIKTIDDAVKATALIDFEQLIVYEASVVRRDSGRSDLPEAQEGRFEGQLRTSDRDSHIAVRFPVDISDERLVLHYDAAVVFKKDEPFRFSEDARDEFSRATGLRTLFPFIRQGVMDLSARAGFAATIGYIHEGDFMFNPVHS